MKTSATKKIITLLCLVFFLILLTIPSSLVFAQPTPPAAPTTGDSTAVYKFLEPLPCPAGVEGCIGGKLETFNVAETNVLSKYLNIILRLLIGIAAVLAVIMIIMGGVQYMSSGLISSKEEGKHRIWNAIIGLLIALMAYLLLFTINPDLLKTEPVIQEVTITTPVVELSDGSYSSSGGAGAGTTTGGVCKTVTNPNNACSVSTLQSSCFGSRAEQASQICNIESAGGRTDVKSGSDLLNNGTGPSYSVGLWQINLTVHKVAGLNCPAAFSGSCGKGTATSSNAGPFVGGPKVGNCSQTVINQALYNQCVAAAQDPLNSTEVACKIYTQSGNSFKPWAYTANKCSVPLK